jgi:TctA family transporter
MKSIPFQFCFADKADIVMMVVGFFSVIVDTFAYAANLVIFGLLTGMYAEQSFSESHNCRQNSSVIIMSDTGCPFGINLNMFNYARLHR